MSLEGPQKGMKMDGRLGERAGLDPALASGRGSAGPGPTQRIDNGVG